MESEATRRRAWIEGQLQPQPDGCFLARPSAWIGGVFALPDAATKDRSVAYCEREHGRTVVYACVLDATVIIGFMAPLAFWTVRELLELGWLYPCVLVGVFLLPRALGALRHRAWLLRAGAVQVPRERWDRTLSRSVWGYYTDSELREMSQLDLIGFVIFSVPAIWFFSITNTSVLDPNPIRIFMYLMLTSFLLPIVSCLREIWRRRSARRRG